MTGWTEEYQFYPWPWACIEVEGLDGTTIRIRGLPLSARSEFQGRLQVLLKIIAELKAPAFPQNLFDDDPKFRASFCRCLELFLIPFDNISVDLGWMLLFGNGDAARGPLAEMEFPSRPDDESPPEPQDEKDDIAAASRLLTSLWTHTGDLKKAIALANDRDIPGRELLNVLKAKNESDRQSTVTPKQKEATANMAALKADKVRGNQAMPATPHSSQPSSPSPGSPAAPH
ncbi:MAG: hypothetical protein ACFCA4_12610 [Cyanophyceae cyanobacterium]